MRAMKHPRFQIQRHWDQIEAELLEDATRGHQWVSDVLAGLSRFFKSIFH